MKYLSFAKAFRFINNFSVTLRRSRQVPICWEWLFILCYVLFGLCACVSPSRNEGRSSATPSASVEGQSQSADFNRTESASWGIDWPVDKARLTQKFKLRGRKPHLGIDLAAPKGTPVMAAHDGKVVYAGRDFHGYGRLVILEQDKTWASFYSHLDKVLVREGQSLRQGEVLGRMGRTGNARGVHLHFELRNNRNPVDPLLYLPAANAN